MFQFEWADEARWTKEPGAAYAPRLLPDDVASAVLLHWEEHCVECAAPECFLSCPLYERRADGNCARFAYGIYPNPAFSGLLAHGADVRFRRWGKLETAIFPAALAPAAHARLARWNVALARSIHRLSRAVEGDTRRHRLDNAWNVARRELLRRLPARGHENQADEFVLECHSFHDEPFRLVVEEIVEGQTVLRHAFDIDPGENFHTLDAGSFSLPGSTGNGLPRLLVYPENDEEARVVFTWLDFVSYSNGRRPVAAAPTAAPAEKVKCVAWDLDNTLWSGILVEDGAGACRPRAEVLETVRALDDRGILQTVVSKNDHDVTWELVERLGLSEYFLYPAINWGAKSQNLRQVAERLNIGLDTFALVDDSPFERAEVETALPMVRTYSDADAVALLERPEFDVVVTEASRRRRQSYLENIERDRVFARFAGDYLDFLRSCEMTMRIFVPVDEDDRRRCLELVQRSNQLNLSTRRYSKAEFAALLEDPDVVCLAIECADRFGSYGIVGFASMKDGDSSVRVGDLVLSCRVARKRVEHSFFRWLGARVLEHGGSEIRADFRPTERNAPLAEVLADLRFAAGADGVYTLCATDAAAAVEVNTVRDEVTAGPLV